MGEKELRLSHAERELLLRLVLQDLAAFSTWIEYRRDAGEEPERKAALERLAGRLSGALEADE